LITRELPARGYNEAEIREVMGKRPARVPRNAAQVVLNLANNKMRTKDQYRQHNRGAQQEDQGKVDHAKREA
jgi:hypothetical protein